jgi:hypothetical protein
MGVKEEHDRLLRTHAAAAEPGDEARPCRQRCKDHGLKVTAAFAADAHSCTEAIQARAPQARLPADHVPTVKKSWGHLNQSR